MSYFLTFSRRNLIVVSVNLKYNLDVVLYEYSNRSFSVI